MNKLEPTSLPSDSLRDERRHRRVRRLFQSFLGFTIFTYLVAIVLGYINNGAINLAGSSITRTILGVGLLSFALAQGYFPQRFLSAAWQTMLACGVVVIGMWWISFTFTSQTEELGRISAVITAIIGIMLVSQAFPPRYVPYAIGFLALGTFTLNLTDLFWSAPRAILDETTRGAAFLVVLVTVITMLAILIRDFQDFSLRAKLIGVTLFLTLALVGVTTYTVGAVIRRTVHEQVEERLHILTQTQAIAMGELLARQVSPLEAATLNNIIQDAVQTQGESYTGSQQEIAESLLATDFLWLRARDNDPLVRQYLGNDVAEQLLEYVEAFPEYAEVFVTDKYGALVAASQRPSDFYQGDEAWWQEAYNSGLGDVYIDAPAFDQSINTLGLAIAVPIYSHTEPGSPDQLIGVIRATYRLDALVDFLGQVDFGEQSKLDLYFADGTALRVVEDDINFRVAPLSPVVLDDLLLSDDAVEPFVYEDVASLVTRYPVSTLSGESFVGDLDWYVVAAQPESEAFVAVTVQQRTNVLLGAVAVLVGGIAAAIVSQVLTAPIIRLTEAATRVTQGDLQTRVLVRGRDEISVLSHSFNLMTDQLLDAISNLEQRVADRTQSLNISTEVGRRLSTILDQQQLVAETVEQVREGFNYYHAQLYLLDQSGKQLLMAGGTGQAGQEMLANGHKIALEQGLVGRAAATNLPIIVPDVSQEGGWLANPLLPETKAEIAIPIAIGEEVVGVLDVQHNVVGGLQQQDADLLLSIANQVAIALQNARLLAEAKQNADRIAQVTGIKEKIQSTTTIEEALQVTVRELGRLTGVPRTTVRLKSNGHNDNTSSH